MTIYLYVKTHRVTGLKYLGKTTSTDPYAYPGSGIDWSKHLHDFGNFVDTEILRECQTEEELSNWGRHYSALWNVVESKNWANLKEEDGCGGAWSEESKAKLSKTNKEILAKLSPEEKTARMKNSCCAPETYTKDRAKNISKALTGLTRSESNKLNCQTGSLAHRQSLTVTERQNIYGAKNAGKTWKLINGKRVWLEKETQNY